MEKKMIWISFTEEYWPGQKEGTTIGRIEVYTGGRYADEEIPWATSKVKEFNTFRAHWDWMEITEYHLSWLREYVKDTYLGGGR